ncbi:MAG: hypothetical protein K2O44_01755 [Clostridia bacterium]|nr:hypothetical protein [Clostridia bacterium]
MNTPRNKKSRSVAAIKQRKNDGAVVLVKLSKLEGKEGKIGKTFIPGVILKPKNHPSLTKDTVVGRETVMGIKQSDSTYKPIYPNDLENTNDKLTNKELRKVRRGVHNAKPKHRKTYKRKLKNWKHRSFKK